VYHAEIVEPCPICGDLRWEPLPNPHDDRAILSDLRVLHEPLDKWSCRRCGFARRATAPEPGVFTSGYALYDHAPGAPREAARQRAYATWIAKHCDVPASVLDVGCGNGSLLLALRDLWPDATLRGIDPSQESVSHARAVGVDAVAGTLEDTVVDASELVISVNVIEHTRTPARFVQALAGAVAPGGTLVLVCPDGSRPSSELVFADHLSSFTRAHLDRMLSDAELTLAMAAQGPNDLGPFQMLVARRSRPSPHPTIDNPDGNAAAIIAARRDYLQGWRALDDVLTDRVGDAPLICFGIGEAAGLLRAYAPATWVRVTACVADAPEQERFGDLPVQEYASAARGTMLLGVRPMSQPAVAARVAQDGHRVIRWDDLIPA
jgi:SAM-dependent methyltransferase